MFFGMCRATVRAGSLHCRLAILSALTLPFCSWAQVVTVDVPPLPNFQFPLRDLTPYTAEIITILDHSGVGFGKKHADADVVAFTGETGVGSCPPNKYCGYPSKNRKAKRPFVVTGVYTGGREDGKTCGDGMSGQCEVLNYRAHSGYDYRCPNGMAEEILAAAEGVIEHHPADAILGSSAAFNTFRIKHKDGWESWYLHASLITAPDKSEVKPGAVVARCGKSAPPDWDIGVHLHFEVRRNGRVVDPYGWEWPTQDPLKDNEQASPNFRPLWLPDWGVPPIVSAVVAAGATRRRVLRGDGFLDDMEVTLWDATSRMMFARPQARVIDAREIEFDIPGTDLPLDSVVVKVGRPYGPRSKGIALSADHATGTGCTSDLVRSGLSEPQAAVELGAKKDQARLDAISSLVSGNRLRVPISASAASVIPGNMVGDFRSLAIAALAPLLKSCTTALEAAELLGSAGQLKSQARLDALKSIVRAGKLTAVDRTGNALLNGTEGGHRAQALAFLAPYLLEGMTSVDVAFLLGDESKELSGQERLNAITAIARSGKFGANGGDMSLVLRGTQGGHRASAIVAISYLLRHGLTAKEAANILGDPKVELSGQARLDAIRALVQAGRVDQLSGGDAELLLDGTSEGHRSQSLVLLAPRMRQGLSGHELARALGEPAVLADQSRLYAIQALVDARVVPPNLSTTDLALVTAGTSGPYREAAMQMLVTKR